MLRFYRTVTIQTRLLLLGALLLVGAAIAFTYHKDMLLVVGGILLGGVALDLVIHRPRLILATLATLLQIVALAYFSFSFSTLLAATNASSADFLLNLLIAIYGLGALLVLQLFLTAFVIKGRIWLNLAVMYVIGDLVFLYLSGVFQSTALGVLCALGTTVIWSALRFPYGRQKLDARLLPTLTKRADKWVGNLFANKQFDIKQTEGFDLLKFVAVPENNSRVYALCVVEAHTTIKFTKHALLLNDQDFTPALEAFISETRRFAKTYHVPRASILPVLLHGDHDDAYAKQISVIKRTKPDLKLGDVYMVNTAGLNRLMRITNQLKPARSKRVRRHVAGLINAQ